MKKLLELRQQKAALKTQMRSMLDKADTEKRNLNEEEGKKFDELRAQGKRTAITVLTNGGYLVGSTMRHGSSSLTRFTGQSAMTSRIW